MQADASPSPAVAEDEGNGEVPDNSASGKMSLTPKAGIREKTSTAQKKSAKKEIKELVITFFLFWHMTLTSRFM